MLEKFKTQLPLKQTEILKTSKLHRLIESFMISFQVKNKRQLQQNIELQRYVLIK